MPESQIGWVASIDNSMSGRPASLSADYAEWREWRQSAVPAAAVILTEGGKGCPRGGPARRRSQSHF
ncbi:hypothetical protein MGN01_04030 [Methylobacterium gnaphalii]|uniref:Uncharacterized protein n=1 Tax=Methylobacterium gnaphalii TaxID=1010610 RepID=A0A512JF33_9HYPH|nr:hypothetical protein MGN01_04030 [Methylobacterium gnaphalii]GLS50775.1 hypothetical protein GCM10007885_36290 [Methylobacterium gnaphalii]